MSCDYHVFIKDMKQSCEKIIPNTADLDFKEFCRDEIKYDAIR